MPHTVILKGASLSTYHTPPKKAVTAGRKIMARAPAAAE
jgi:hypothetical protein